LSAESPYEFFFQCAFTAGTILSQNWRNVGSAAIRLTISLGGYHPLVEEAQDAFERDERTFAWALFIVPWFFFLVSVGILILYEIYASVTGKSIGNHISP
jgi:hypothetical protein